MLSDRRQRVLQALVQEYIANAQPVGSKTLVNRYGLHVSPATVRNELSILEEEGYVVSPHTSAGRIPTDAGYRAFVNKLLEEECENPQDGSFEGIRARAGRLDQLLDEVSAQLASLTECLSVVMAPSILAGSVKQVSLVSFSLRTALMVVVTSSGKVLNRGLEFDQDVDPEELAEIQNSINILIGGKTASQIGTMRSETTLVDTLTSPLGAYVLDQLFSCMKEGEPSRSSKLGLPSLLSKPEFSNSTAALPVLRAIEDDVMLLGLLEDVFDDGDLEILIGSENPRSQFSGVSVVAAQYGPADAHGIVAVIGPTRMDYSKVIHAVRAARSELNR